jgi:hypothetical protein
LLTVFALSAMSYDYFQNRLAAHAAAGSAANEDAQHNLKAHRTLAATTAVTATAAAAAALVRVPAHQQVDERFETSMADLLHRKVYSV